MQSSSTPAPDAKASSSEDKSSSEFNADNEHKVHFYNDGNIVLNLQGRLFRVHKSVLSLHSRVFSDMFSLALPPSDAEDADEVQLHDDALKFARVLDALYKGM
ncbi:The BTB (BR-C, ttk and bab)/POZ (Pox virus and Zinc finger) domain [Ceratobasidium sp. AG-Ba]|nr:The BTB (BR-C, ttk and bab)/POZ (Pox virus and Zinc finger) domain [Ceratobasidium sp. AG-Ba]